MLLHSRSTARERLYWVLLAVGTAVPFYSFIPWLLDHGLDVPLFVIELFTNRISSFFGWDVILTVATLWVLACVDRELSMRSRLIIAAAALLGGSVGLPTYLLLRERESRERYREVAP